MREIFITETDWRFLILTPGAPWAGALFPPAIYPRDRCAFALSGEAESVLRKQHPTLVLTTTTGLDPTDAPVLSAAKELRIRTATLIESWDNVWKMERVAHGQGKAGQRVILPDVLCVWNTVMREHALRAFPSVPPSAVIVTGSPRLDYFGPRYAARLPSRAEVLRALGLDPARPFLHFATTELYDHGHVARVLAHAKHEGRLPPELQFYASVHPGGNLARHQPWAERYGFTIRYSPGRQEGAPHPDFRYNPLAADLLRLVTIFREAAVMVNLSSTVALESCLADRPTICAFFGKPFDWWRWSRSMIVRDFREHYADLLRGGGIRVARNPALLVSEVQASLANPARDHEGRRRSAETIAGTLAGDSAERVLRALRPLVEG